MAYDFTRTSSQAIQLASSPITAHPLTMACWFSYDDAANAQTLISLTDNDSGSIDGWAIRVRGDVASDPLEAITLQAGAGGGDGARNGAGTTTGTWYHGCGVFSSASSRRIYLNGGDTAENTIAYTPSGVNTGFLGVLRTSSGGSGYTDGRIAEVGIWNVALTAAEALVLATGASPLTVRPSALVFYAPLVRELVDRKGGLSLSNLNTAVVAAHPRSYYPHRRLISGPAAPGTTGEADLTGSASTGQQTAPSVVFSVPL